jgi:uncharacterized membrane protein
MRSLHRLVVAGATIIALTAVVPSVSASSHKAFHLEKTCVVVSPVENQCTVTASSFKAIPVGTLITYDTSGGFNALVATITIKNGSATGQCAILDAVLDPTKSGTCSFATGTGRLTQFHLTVAVTRTPDWSLWYWDGTYWFGDGGHDGDDGHNGHDGDDGDDGHDGHD